MNTEQKLVLYALRLLLKKYADGREAAYRRQESIRKELDSKGASTESDYDLGFWNGLHSAYTMAERETKSLVDCLDDGTQDRRVR